MPVRVRKLLGGAAIVAFLAIYVAAAVTLARWVPDFWALKLVYFLVVGMAWGAPLIPLITWMNRGP